MNAVTKSEAAPSAALASFIARASDRADFLRCAGLPSRRQEAWRYTSLQALDRVAFADAPVIDEARARDLLTELAADCDGPCVVFINGRLSAANSTFPQDVELKATVAPMLQEHPLAILNAALRQDGVHLHVPEGVDAGEVRLISINDGAAPFSTHPHHVVSLAPGARLTLRDVHVGKGHYLSNPFFEFDVAKNATLTHVKLQQESDDATHLALVAAQVAEHATYDSFTLTLGAKLARHEVHADLHGPHAAAHANVAQLLGEDRHADLTSVITHAAPDCDSRQTVKNVITDAAHAVFQGKIFVDRVAQKTDGYQMNQALLLSEKAQIDSKPELEIYADDVKCSHGATVGALDDEQLFYLRSRGIELPQARSMLVGAFLQDAVDLVTDESLRAWLDGRIARWWERRVS
ncbi:iron-sulfur assembly protein SufD [Neoasaia chiangmaiensis NBRC 101099]|uniref:SUF system FeS cluster assembly SufBD core domain-containing protein n=1 Tax=Neoasaia chiangmaiensis TaxID=320497 RepID=A0A1U9KMS3_9PROT|nr:Fe-S cluster assembly protein SufD [Neoasaia chiangmaiensis]AQS87082.1 hypothetical protein A0U93_03030 [Neoasaia chiangmaiensis]GBR38004.1 iron-sulfur assembly protein SufD [Neoasaia chiangmaiensis NBRC 101099]GEN15226.1 Fe-S cluster assembly protein SufD [Neoasaia chiangmaiensis]